MPATTPSPYNSNNSPIAGSVLPIKRAEELLATLPGVISARIIANEHGAIDEIHVLTSTEFTAKQTVRNIESALIAHLGLRVDHRKISVAASAEPSTTRGPTAVPAMASSASHDDALSAAVHDAGRRRVYFEDVEVRRSRVKGMACRVTLRKGDETFVGEAEGADGDRARVELAARATLVAIIKAEGEGRSMVLEGAKQVDAFDRSFVFVGVSARIGRDAALLTGSCELRDSSETASALAVLDATNRWIAFTK